MTEYAPGARRWPLLASVFFVSFTVLSFEVGLTRIFSVMFRYHYAFLAVSGAVCGLGLGGFAWHLLASRERTARLEVGWAALGLALLIPATIILLFGTSLSSLLAARLWAAFIPLLPFGFAGAFLAEVFRRGAAESGRLYQADLAGAALAAVLIVPLIALSGALHLVFVLGALGAMGAVCWALFARNRRLKMVGLVCAILLLAGWPVSVKADFLRLRPLQTGSLDIAKPMLRDLADPGQRARIIDTEWSAYARTDLVRYELPGGNFGLQIFTDGETPAAMVAFDGDLRKVHHLTSILPYFAFHLSPKESLLSIGPGGGMDFLLGSLAGFKKMEGVEISASLVRMVERHKDLNGDVYHRPGVSVAVDDGRSYVRRSREKYNLIVSSLTQTATTGNVGVALVESYIHTREAFADYYDHLTAEGRYALVTQSEYLILRAALTAIEVMKERGISPAEGCKHLLILAAPRGEIAETPYRYLLVWKKTPFSPGEIAFAGRVVSAGLGEMVFIPGQGGAPLLSQVARGETTPEEIYSAGVHEGGTHLNLRPATDERPFFLDLSFGVPKVLKGLLIGSLAAAILYTGILLFLRRRAGEGSRGLKRWLAYFSALGAGFMLVEIPLAQKFILFLGKPTLSLAVILFCLLIGASLGSRLSQGWGVDCLRRKVILAGLVVFLLAGAYGLFLSPLLNLFLAWPLAARLVLPIIFLVPLGIALGIPFPSGLRLISLSWRGEIPWMWGINGMMSVAGSVLAAAGAKIIGFNGCLFCAAVIYGGLVLFLPRGGVVQAEKNG